LPTESEVKLPTAPEVVSVTVSPLYTPTRAAPLVFNVAVGLALYTLFPAVIPETEEQQRRYDDAGRRRELRRSEVQRRRKAKW